MKKITNNIIAKVSMLCLLVITNMQLWAQSATGSSESPLNQAMNKPAFWVGVALFIACIAAFFLVGREKKENQYR